MISVFQKSWNVGSDEMKKRVPYGVGDFETIRKENMYYIDKTSIIEKLERHQYPFFIRPRRFGKSLLVSMLEDYYDIEKREQFDELFKGLYIHEYPTAERNTYLVLRLDFTGIETDFGKEKLFESFTDRVKEKALFFLDKYENYFENNIYEDMKRKTDPAQIINAIVTVLQQSQKQTIILIDEHDNFANDLIGANKDDLYYEILSKTGFVRTFYEALKSGAGEGAISRIFMTGVSPIMLDDMTSGFNIAKNITLDETFSTSLGFTQDEVEAMMDYYWGFIQDEPENTPEKKEQALKDMKSFYNGYLFSIRGKERVYNPDMVLHFMDSFQYGTYPEEIVDTNVKTGYGKLQRLLKINRKSGTTGDITWFEEISEKEEVLTKLKQMFPLEAITGKDEIISLMYYMGLLTIKEPVLAMVRLKVPNLVIKELYWEYFYQKIRMALNDTLNIETIGKGLIKLATEGNPDDFVHYTYDKVLKYMSNRDLIQMDEKHLKMIFLSFLSVNMTYIPYSELELNGGYSDIVLYPDTRYGVKNSQIWELKFLKKSDDREDKLKEAREQIKRYETDEKFLRLAEGTQLYKYIILGSKDGVEIVDESQ